MLYRYALTRFGEALLSLWGALTIVFIAARLLGDPVIMMVDALFNDPRNAYTYGLLKSLPDLGGTHGPRRRLKQIDGMPPDLRQLPPGDPFAPRNPFATERCFRETPSLRQAEDSVPGHLVAAWYDLRDVTRRRAG